MEESNKNSELLDLLKYMVIAAIIVVPFRVFVAQPYIVEGSSMFPTFKDGDYLIVDQISYRLEAPNRGDVVIMRYPEDTSKFFIKRLIGFPNEKIEIKEGKITIFNDANPKGEALSEPYIEYGKIENAVFQLKEGEYFVMGDNRAGSFDSRYWGPLPAKDLVGTPLLRLMPISNMGVRPGKENL